MITVGEVIGIPHLGLRLLSGSGGLDRPVSWGHVCELQDPTPWLEGGELLMTNGIGIRPEADRQAAYIALLDTHGAAGLAIGYGMLAPPLCSEMLKEADGRDFPLLEIPLDVPFLAISKAVADANQSEAQRRLLAQLRIFDALRAETTGPPDTGKLLGRLEAISGFRLYLASPSGAPLLPGLPPPPEPVRGAFPRGADAPPAVPGGFIVPLPGAGRIGYLVALDDEAKPSAGLSTAQHIATVAALEVANVRRERESTRRIGAEILSELLVENLDAGRVASRLQALGFTGEDEVVLLAVRTPSSFDQESLHEAWNELALPHLLLSQRDLIALVPSRPEALQVLQAMPPVRAGASRIFRIGGDFARAFHEASWALERAVDAGQNVVRFPTEDDHLAWLPTDSRTLRQLADHVLRPIIDYDGQKGTELLRSLRVWLEHDRSLTAASAVLHVHKHTLGYRLRRVEALTGRDLSSLAEVVDFWLAIRAHEISLGVTVGSP